MRDIKPKNSRPRRLPGRSVPLTHITPEAPAQPERPAAVPRPAKAKPAQPTPRSRTITPTKRQAPRLGARERSIVLGLLLIAVLTAGLAAWLFLPTVSIEIVLRTAPLLVDEEVTVRADGTEIVSVVPGTSFFRETEVTGTAPVASTEIVGSKATGTVRLINRTFDEQTIKARSRLVTDNDELFFMTESATIPAASGGTLASATVAVEAAAAGPDGNVESGRLNFVALDEASRTLVYAEVVQPLSGGSGEVVSVVREADLTAARDAAADQARAAVEHGVTDELPGEWSILAESWELELLDFSTDAADGDQRADIPYTARVSARVIGFEQAALEAVLEQALKSRLEEGFMLFPGPISFTKTVKEVDWESGEAIVSARVTHTTIPELSLDTLREKLTSRSATEARTYLEGLPGVQSVNLTTWPFWANHIPRIQNRISIDLQPERQP